MPNEEENTARLNESRNNNDSDEPDKVKASGSPVSATFPWLMLGFATIFDLVGLIPIINIFSELLAGLTLWLWQKQYVPKINPIANIISMKIIDFISLGFLPSNIATVIYAYIKKKTASATESRLGQVAIKSFAQK